MTFELVLCIVREKLSLVSFLNCVVPLFVFPFLSTFAMPIECHAEKKHIKRKEKARAKEAMVSAYVVSLFVLLFFPCCQRSN